MVRRLITVGAVTAAGAGSLILASPAGALPVVSPACARPGATVTYQATRSKGAPTRARIFLAGIFVEQRTLRPTGYVPRAQWLQVADVALQDQPVNQFVTNSVISAQFVVPTATTFLGQPIDFYKILIELRDDAGTSYGFDSTNESSFDLDTKHFTLQPTAQLSLPNGVGEWISGFHSSPVFVHILDSKGHAVRTTALGRSHSSAPCGTTGAPIPYLNKQKFKPGVYTFVANSSRTNAHAPGSLTRRLRLKR